MKITPETEEMLANAVKLVETKAATIEEVLKCAYILGVIDGGLRQCDRDEAMVLERLIPPSTGTLQ
jgi:hypothetical protein